MAWLTYVFAAALICGEAYGNAVVFTESTWNDMLQDEWMVEFYAPWCPACKALVPVWNDFADWAPHLNIRVGQVDITQNPGLSGRFMVTALPTIYHVKDGVFRQYSGGRDRDSLMNFVQQQKWSQVKPISNWKHPNSIQMSTVAQFFRWSYQIRAIHTHLVDHTGLPYWLSYALFALATIVIGATLGLLIVAVIDFVFPPKALEYQRMSESVSRGNDSDLAEDESVDQSPKAEKDSTESASKKKKSKKSIEPVGDGTLDCSP
ncbi:thioredoxin-related transmembrane protein 1 [Galendromus occidentalis]|uniref:Thioredoxin-related transmembrane protein 1 n=1 Tax=Galendromus occidentalis TaxID=34638 RepID=A0AAJ6QNV7_9ACAR|nr:thioredoxin-related transmembrane protein 1 [Galendromus occidentalis]